MAFRHGVYKSEVPTGILSPSQGEAGLPVVVGAAPVFLADSSNVNKPVLCYSYSEAVKALGFVHRDWAKWTLCEFMYSQFALYAQSPAVLINVFDPARHKEEITDEVRTIVGGEINLGQDVILSAGITFKSIPIDEEAESEALTLEYESGYDDDGSAVITLTGSSLPERVKVSYVKAKPSLITDADIIGGVNAVTGEYKGLELINQIYPKFRLIPGIILAPGFSSSSTVAAVMSAKASNINGLFTAISIVDLPCDNSGAPVYSKASEVKNSLGMNSSRQIVCWPMVKLGDDVYHLSTHLAGLMNATDNAAGDIPYMSPSNKALQIDGCVNASGQEISLGHEEAVYLNSQGITTALNFASGWTAWGNRTAAYPAVTDPKDAFIPVRRMFDFIGNTFITTFWQSTDLPLTARLVRTIVNSFNVYLNGLQAREMILGGSIEFIEEENPVTALQDGILIFHLYITPPVPAEVIEAVLEFDSSYLSALASSLG